MSILNKDTVGLKARQLMDAQRSIARVIPILPWLAAVVFSAALAAGLGTLYLVGKVSAAARVVQTQEAPTYKVKRDSMAPAEYQDTITWLTRLHPSVQVAVTKKGALQVSINEGQHHSEWLYTLAALQSQGADIIWEVSDFCVGRCNGPVATAIVTGNRQKLQQN